MATLTITFTIADAKMQAVKDAVCQAYEYNPETDGTQNAFIKKVLLDVLRTAYKRSMQEADTAASRARIATELTDAGLG